MPIKTSKAYQATATILAIFLIFIHWITLMAALGHPVMWMMVRLGVAVLFVVLGNYLSQVRQNYFFGIKTPWTLANEQVWKPIEWAVCICIVGNFNGRNCFFNNQAAFVMIEG